MRNLQVLGLFSIAAIVVSCSSEPERNVLGTFVTAVQSGNEDAIDHVSLVEFPGEEISAWEIVEIGPETSEPFPLADLQEELIATEEELEQMIKTNDAFVQENEELYLEYKPKKDEDPEAEFTGELKEFDEEFSARMEKQKALTEKIEEIKDSIDAVKAAAALSTNTPGLGSSYDGEVLQKTVHVKFDGKDYTVTIKQYALVNTSNNLEPMTRWIITDINEGAT